MKRFGFTLAEVLITLGIIGVVAALTLPNLIANYQKKALVTQLQKQVNVLNNNFKRIMADEGVDNLCQTSIINNCGNNNVQRVSIDALAYKKYFGLDSAPSSSKTVELLNLLGIDSTKIVQTRDGAVIAFNSDLGGYYSDILIDINGDKGPNIGGRDRFQMAIDKEKSIISRTGYNNNDNNELCIEIANTNIPSNEVQALMGSWIFGGIVCFDKIMNEGWEMNY